MNDHQIINCANCSTPLTGKYCQECGQAAHIHRSILHMLEESLHGILHFDNKAWRTFPTLIFNPGKLTRDYIGGKRTYYVSPLYLFLFLNVFMFVGLSYSTGGMSELGAYSIRKNDLSEASIPNAVHHPSADSLLASSEDAWQRAAEKVGTEKSANTTSLELPVQPVSESASLSSGRFEKIIQDALRNPELTLYKIKGTASKFAFILIPISLPFISLLFLKRKDVLLFDHCIFMLYSMSFVWVLVMFALLLVWLGLASWSWLLFAVFIPVHIFAQLRGAYDLGISAALWRTFAMLFIAAFSLANYITGIVWLSLH